MATFGWLSNRRPHPAGHQGQPDEQSNEQEDLPESAEIDVFEPLMPEPKVGDEPKPLLNREPLSDHRTDNNDQQTNPQKVHTQSLELRLISADGRRDIQASCQPRSGNPEDAQLCVPGACDCIRQPFGQW